MFPAPAGMYRVIWIPRAVSPAHRTWRQLSAPAPVATQCRPVAECSRPSPGCGSRGLWRGTDVVPGRGPTATGGSILGRRFAVGLRRPSGLEHLRKGCHRRLWVAPGQGGRNRNGHAVDRLPARFLGPGTLAGRPGECASRCVPLLFARDAGSSKRRSRTVRQDEMRGGDGFRVAGSGREAVAAWPRTSRSAG